MKPPFNSRPAFTPQDVLAALRRAAKMLRSMGCVVITAKDGVQAVHVSAHQAYDLILMDVQMPVLDGPSATSQIRDLEAQTGRKPVPIVALTANAMVHQVETYFEVGMNDIVAKPIRVPDLLRVIQAVANAETYEEATEALSQSRAA